MHRCIHRRFDGEYREKGMVTTKHILDWLTRSARVMKEKGSYLTGLDATIGDGDHGINMERGFNKVLEKIESWKNKDISEILKETGMTLISSVGGASGPLYGTFFITAASKLSNRFEASVQDMATAFRAGADALARRGRAHEGEKTILDALFPAVRALEEAAGGGESMREAFEKTARLAKQGMEATVMMQAKKGRASYLGERSIGHQDPGASSTYLLLNALYETLL